MGVGGGDRPLNEDGGSRGHSPHRRHLFAQSIFSFDPWTLCDPWFNSGVALFVGGF